jgi:excisionase family DNA binding protein
MSDKFANGRKRSFRARQFKLFENRIMPVDSKPNPSAAFLRAEEVASLLGVGVSTVRRWARKGVLKSIRPGKTWLFAVKEIESFLFRKEWEIFKHETRSL